MSQYYGESQWPGAGPATATPPPSTWDHQTPPPPPARSGASSVIPREDSAAFSNQIDEVERAIDNLVKSGKMFGQPGRHGRGASGQHGPRHASAEFGDPRTGGGHSGPNLQNFYAAQRHQSSRGSNEAEQMMQAKRRMAAQRERELRNYHQEQQYNRNVLADVSYNGKPDRTLSPNNSLPDDERREVVARQRPAMYEGQYDDAGANRVGMQGLPPASAGQRGPSPLAYDYRRPSVATAPGNPGDGRVSRANSNASPQSNTPTNMGMFDNAVNQQATRTSNSSPTGGSPPRAGETPKSGQTGNTVAPIGTRPLGNSQAPNPALNKRSTTPLRSPLSHGFSASGNGDDMGQGVATSGVPSNPPSASAEGYNGWGSRSGVWGNKSNLGVQASVWG
ncbi:Uu.00g117850.m01.CDS01 [Anthostomella pinea]|uniref:Uu.00g117850.m01.CDS01 n=1 Tax=Anthostomella pinea TaxID=933095 RepID=A0AAI8VH06_9PEZI|nr:Uu.00g117850.m01.CDS01 [Anthostomella pinea]